MKVLLFALTGFGNNVLDSLLSESCEVVSIFTRHEKCPFPYYPEKNLTRYAKKKKIPVYENFEWEQVKSVIKKTSPNLLLVSTFHKIIPEEIISSVPYCINLHPSLLPKYRGSTPIAWAIHNKEKESGITAHFLTKEMDAGDILIQKKIPIDKKSAEGDLRKKLAMLAAEVSKQLIRQIETNTLKPMAQNEKEATYFPKFKIK